MAQSNYLRSLSTRCRRLRRHFLPATYSPTGDYTDRQYDRTAAYRVLVHAEFEHYFEEVAWAAVQTRLAEFRGGAGWSELLFGVAVAAVLGWKPDEFDVNVATLLGSGAPKSSIAEAIYTGCSRYRKLLDSNNGIREDNLKKMFFPLGVDFKALDPLWMTNLDMFGQDRGEVAHHSIGAIQTIDPESEEKKVLGLVAGLHDLDSQIVSLGGLS